MSEINNKKAVILLRFSLENPEDLAIYQAIQERDKNRYPSYKTYISEAVKLLTGRELPVTKSEVEQLLMKYCSKNQMLP